MILSNLSLAEILRGLQAGEFSSKELVEYYYAKIKELNDDYNVFLFLNDVEDLLALADEADKERKEGSEKKLLGVPFALKDSFMAVGTPTTAGDTYLDNTMSEYNATIVQKLLDEGAILIGKTNMDSWGFGSTTENSAFGPTKNPFDKERTAGGSSGGAAAAVALDMCSFAIGEDTGGSLRNPASYCGVYALKPTYGRISRFGCIAYASSLDSIGPITRAAQDLNLIASIIEAEDDHDMTIDSGLKNKDSELKKRFAYSLDFIPQGVSEEMKETYLQDIEKFKSLGYEAVEVRFSLFEEVIPTYYITAMSEASTNLSRYQGTRYGKLNSELKMHQAGLQTWEELFTKARTEGFTSEAKRRILMGAYILSEGFYDAYYKKAQKIRNKLLNEINEILETTDFILSPVVPSVALKIGEKTTNPVEMYLEDVYTVTANLAGIPAVAFPSGISKEGLPIGMQIMGMKGSDNRLVETISKLN